MAQTRSIRQHTRWLTNWLQPFLAIGPASRRMALALFLWGVGEGMWMYIRPLYVSELGGNPVQVGQVLGIAGLAPVLLMLPAGRLIDRIGPRLLLVVGWWWGTLSGVVLALATGWQWLIPGFFMYSMSAAAIPAVNAYVAQDVQLDARRTVRDIQATISLVFAAYIAGTIFSPILGGWVGEHFGLRYVFWLSAGWFSLSALVVMSLPRLSWPPVEDAEDSLEPTAPWWRFSAAQVRIYAALLVLFFVMSLGYVLAPQYLEDVRAMSLGAVGALGTAIALGGVVWLLVLGSRSSRLALVISSLAMAAAFAGLVLFPAYGQFWTMALVYFSLGTYLTVRTLTLGVVSELTPVEHRGTNYGMVETVFGIGAFLGPLCAGLFYDVDPALPFLLAAVALVLWSGVVWLTLRGPDDVQTM